MQLPESPFLATAPRASVTKTLRIHTTETEQNHRIRPDMCPIIELYNEGAVHVSRDCSSNEMRIANNQHHVTADVHATCLNIN